MNIDYFKNEEDLICVNTEELDNNEPYFIDKEEAIQIINRMTKECNDCCKKLADNCYVFECGDVLYFICPLNARKEVKEDWEDLRNYFNSFLRRE